MPQFYNFVKFQRGSEAAYGRLRVKDPDTLYFVYKNPEDKMGNLYLGDKLISGGSDTTIIPSSFANLSDANIIDPVNTQIISYDAEQDKWVNCFLIDIVGDLFNIKVFRPSNIEDYSDFQILDSYTNGKKYNDLAVLREKLYIYTPNGWELLSNPPTRQELDAINERIDSLVQLIGHPAEGEDNPATGLYELFSSYPRGLRYKFIDSIYDIDYDDENVDQYIYLIRKQSSSSYYDVFDEYLYVNGSMEKIGTVNGDNEYINQFIETVNNLLYDHYEQEDPDDDFSPWILVPGLITRIQNLETLTSVIQGQIGDINELFSNVDSQEDENKLNIVETINILNSKLTWGSFPED